MPYPRPQPPSGLSWSNRARGTPLRFAAILAGIALAGRDLRHERGEQRARRIGQPGARQPGAGGQPGRPGHRHADRVGHGQRGRQAQGPRRRRS